MNIFKAFVKKYFYYFSYFYRIVKGRLFIAFGLSMLVALMDGLGLTMFLPLLEMADGGNPDGKSMGRFGIILTLMQNYGIPLNISVVLLLMALFFSLKGVLKFVEQYYSILLRRFFIKQMRLSIVNLFDRYAFKNFIKQDSGRIQNAATSEIERIVVAFSSYMNVLQAFAMIFIYVGMAFSVNVRFSLLVMSGGALSNFLYASIFKKSKKYSVDISKNNQDFQSLLIQKITYFKYLKSSGLLSSYGNKLREQIEKVEFFYKKLGLLSSIITAIREPIIILIIVTVILVEINLYGGSIAGIILSLLFFYRSLTYLLALQSYWNSVIANYGSLVNLKNFTEELANGKDTQGTIKKDGLKECMELHNLNFSYGSHKVLHQLSLSINRNQVLAIVGESGSGKSTLMNILAGLYLPDSGSLFIDGVEIREIDRNHFQKHIGYITQEPVIFDDSIFNNVSFWDVDNATNRERCREALRKAAIFDFVDGLEEGEDSRLGNNGIMVSGGQKQRISIARELYKGINLLLMDEATSALDSGTEMDIQENIERLRGKVTIIIIAHRLSTIKNADQIFLLKQGQIASYGTFNELESKSIDFSKMISLQAF